MFAQVVFDLPLEDHFDYSIPASLQNRLKPGWCVKVSLGIKNRIGVVVGITQTSSFERIKSIRSTDDHYPVLDEEQIALASQIRAYYGCSLGQALFTMLRGCMGQEITRPLIRKPGAAAKLFIGPSADYQPILIELIKNLAVKNERALVLVPDQYVTLATERMLKGQLSPDSFVIGTRSMVFRSLKDISLVIMIDENNPSYKQEQTPMYETRDVLLMRSKREHVEVAFISMVPSIELMFLVEQKEVQLKEPASKSKVKSQIVDLNTYNSLWRGILSPAVVSSLESNNTKGFRSVLVLNHRGSFAMTRCSECGFVLQCQRCDSSMIYSRIQKQYICRHCSFHLPGDTICPTCKKLSWKSFGLGIEQLQKALQGKFPLARIEVFERGMDGPTKQFDILIGTVALLRFKDSLKASLVAVLDIDGELNRLDMRSCSRAYVMAQEFKNMAQDQYLIQSRNLDHYVMQAILKEDSKLFYQEDMRIRKELKICPFGHHVSLQIRHKNQKLVQAAAQRLFQALNEKIPHGIKVDPPGTEGVAKKRDYFRMNILLHARDVPAMIAFIKATMKNLKRLGKVIITFNVDP